MIVNIKIRRPIDEVLNEHRVLGHRRIFYRNFAKQLIQLISKGYATVRVKGISERYIFNFLEKMEERGYDTSQLRIVEYPSDRGGEILCTIWRQVKTYEDLKKFYEIFCGLDPEVMDAILEKLVEIGELHLI
ncbi:MAG: hypothetical protein DRP01_11180 [Archaeoglobales archaeon]|nr:MAG: hypothetical protein DRP01_11180 [Archaeoglobales archaeon]